MRRLGVMSVAEAARREGVCTATMRTWAKRIGAVERVGTVDIIPVGALAEIRARRAEAAEKLSADRRAQALRRHADRRKLGTASKQRTAEVGCGMFG